MSKPRCASKPLLLLDVDGVLLPFGPMADAVVSEPRVAVDHIQVRHRRELPAWLERLASAFQIVWCTSWEDDANQMLAPFLGLPELPVIRLDDDFDPGETRKLPAIKRYVGASPFAWADDEIGNDAHDWARTRPSPTLLLEIHPNLGLLADDVAELLEFAAKVAN